MPPSLFATSMCRKRGVIVNEKLQDWKAGLKNKEVCVVGIGISHLPLIDYLVACGAHVTACDRKTEAELGETAQRLKAKGVKLILGEAYLSNLSGDVIFKTPGLRPDVPELLRAKEQGIKVTTEMEVFLELCPAPVTAVTGSDGKTTTTTLTNIFIILPSKFKQSTVSQIAAVSNKPDPVRQPKNFANSGNTTLTDQSLL